jgi:hypothetical protein
MRTVDLPFLAVVVAVGGALIAVPAKADGGYRHEWNHGYANHGSWNHDWWEHYDGWAPGAFFAPPPVYSPPPMYYSAPPQSTPITPAAHLWSASLLFRAAADYPAYPTADLLRPQFHRLGRTSFFQIVPRDSRSRESGLRPVPNVAM